MNKKFIYLMIALTGVLMAACTTEDDEPQIKEPVNTENPKDDNNDNGNPGSNEESGDKNESEVYLEGLKPQAALEYMKAHDGDLFIIDARADEWYNGYTQFVGNHHFPYTTIERHLDEIPSDRPIIINCGAGVVAPQAYRKIKASGKKVKQIAWIDGTPLFNEYNDWKNKQ